MNINDKTLDILSSKGFVGSSRNEISKLMIEFAKLHVTEALKQASEKVDFELIKGYRSYIISKKSILNSYNLDNIK